MSMVGLAVTASYDVIAVGSDNRFGYFAWGLDGGSWSYLALDGGLNAVTATAWNDAVAVGAQGTLWRWDGRTLSPEDAGVPDDLLAVWRAPDGRLWATTRGGAVVFRDLNGSWQVQSASTNALNALWAPSPDDLFAVGDYGAIWHSTGDGTWVQQASGVIQALYGVWGSSGSDVYAVGNTGRVIHRIGGSWAVEDAGTGVLLSAVWGSASDDVYVGGNAGTVLHSTGDGVWTKVPCAGNHAILAIDGRGPNVYLGTPSSFVVEKH
jgi:hypothetical protein